MITKVQSCLGVAFFLAVCVGISQAQDQIEVDAKYRTADTNNAVIQGRVSLPSGFSAEQYVKITLRNSYVVLSTSYTSKHGEFRFDNLSEGMYYVMPRLKSSNQLNKRLRSDAD